MYYGLNDRCPRYDIWDICLSTPLRTVASNGEEGVEEGTEKSEKKAILLVALQPRESQDAANYDRGEIPGDHLGNKAYFCKDLRPCCL